MNAVILDTTTTITTAATIATTATTTSTTTTTHINTEHCKITVKHNYIYKQPSAIYCG